MKGQFHCIFCGKWAYPGACAPTICKKCLRTNATVSVSDWLYYRNLNWRLRNMRLQKTGNIFGE